MKNNPSFAKQFPLQSTNASLMSKLNSDIECYGSCLEFSVTVTMILHFTLKQLDRKYINITFLSPLEILSSCTH